MRSVTAGEVAGDREQCTWLAGELQMAIAAIPRVEERQISLKGGYNIEYCGPREMAPADVNIHFEHCPF
tara:strand:+ start:22 stop:228 length:207 start_codon:yes stop_codon:yes gene_type:complete